MAAGGEGLVAPEPVSDIAAVPLADDAPSAPSLRRLTAAHSLAYASYNGLTPVLAIYLVSLGHDAAFVGLTIAVFSVVSIAIRPLAGLLADTRDLRRTYSISVGVMGLTGLVYMIPNVAAIFAGRVVQGGAWAMLNTAAPVIALEKASVARRARAIGSLNMGRNLSVLIAPALALWIATNLGFGLAFGAVAAAGAAGAVIAWSMLRIPHGPPTPSPARGSMLGSLVARSALAPAAIQGLVFSSAPLIYTFVPLFGLSIGVADVALVYVVAGACLVLFQPLARLSDRFGRTPSIVVGILFAVAGLISFTLATELIGLLVAASLWAVGVVLVEPSTTALVVDRADPARRGAAMATYTAAFQLGNALGATAWGALIVTRGFTAAFAASAVVTATALVIVAGLIWRAGRVI